MNKVVGQKIIAHRKGMGGAPQRKGSRADPGFRGGGVYQKSIYNFPTYLYVAVGEGVLVVTKHIYCQARGRPSFRG